MVRYMWHGLTSEVIMNLYYRIKNIIRKAKYTLKCKCQRFKRGYAYSDVWDMNQWFMDTIKPMLTHLNEHGCGYPMEFNDRDEWCAILDEMINCLTLMDKDKVEESLGFGGIEGWRRMDREDHIHSYEIMIKNKNRFFELFNKHFYDLWD